MKKPHTIKSNLIFRISILLFILQCLNSHAHSQNKVMNNQDFIQKDWKKILTPLQYQVTRENGTERPFTGEYDTFFEKGTYVCICCEAELFSSDDKYNSGCGWPAFSDLKDNKNVLLKTDFTHGMNRVEVRCSKCDAHLGHVFKDGPKPTGLRYCINSVSIKFIPEK